MEFQALHSFLQAPQRKYILFLLFLFLSAVSMKLKKEKQDFGEDLPFPDAVSLCKVACILVSKGGNLPQKKKRC